MHKYYKGSLRNMTISEIRIYQSYITVVTNSTVLKKNAIFYKSQPAGMILEFENKEPIYQELEANAYLVNHAKESLPYAKNLSCSFYIPSELTPCSKTEVKKLEKIRKIKTDI